MSRPAGEVGQHPHHPPGNGRVVGAQQQADEVALVAVEGDPDRGVGTSRAGDDPPASATASRAARDRRATPLDQRPPRLGRAAAAGPPA